MTVLNISIMVYQFLDYLTLIYTNVIKIVDQFDFCTKKLVPSRTEQKFLYIPLFCNIIQDHDNSTIPKKQTPAVRLLKHL